MDEKYEKVNSLLSNLHEKIDNENEEDRFKNLGIDKERLEKLKKIVVDKKKTFDDLK